MTLGQSLLVYILVGPLLPSPGHSYMSLNTKIKLNLVGTMKMQKRFYGRISFSAKLFQVALSGRDAENCNQMIFLYNVTFAEILFSISQFTSYIKSYILSSISFLINFAN